MPRLFASASSQYIEKTAIAITAYPFTMATFYNPTTSNATGTIVGLGRSGAANNYVAMGVTSAAKPFVEVGPNGTSVTTTHGTSVTNGRWGHIAAVLTSSTSRSLYFNGVALADTAAAAFPTSLGVTTIGACVINTRTSFSNGIIAHVAIWNVALTADEISKLSSGVSPLHIRPISLVNYVPVWGQSPETDMISPTGFTLGAAPTVSTNLPPISQPNNNFQFVGVSDGMSVSEKIR